MPLFKQKEAKRFTYRPRYYKHESDDSPFRIKHKFDDERESTLNPGNLKQRFKRAFNELKKPQEKIVSKRLIIIFLILVMIVLYIIDFDLSIFITKVP